MKFVSMQLFVIGCAVMSMVLAHDGPANDVATELQALLEGLNTAVVKGDMGAVHDTLQKGKSHLAELIPKIESQKSREVIAAVKTSLDELIGKLSNNQANMDDVRAFLTDATEKLKQRLADKMKEMSN